MTYKSSNELVEISNSLIPEQTMTMAKKASNFPMNYPKYVDSANGANITDVDGNSFIDYSMALGVYTLGYNHPLITKAVLTQMKKGSLFSLPHKVEIELAKKLVDIIPSAEMVRFFKNGADATGISIRLARSFTSKNHVIQTGYHGHHDWYSFTLRDSGVLKETKDYTHSVNYNDFDAIQRLVFENNNDVAAIIIETAFEEPKNNYLGKVRELCEKNNILLIFDEMWTGFRFKIGGAQEYFKVIPDISTFSKGISNGYPISVVAGKKDIMKCFEKIWGFTTFGGDAIPMVAAIETIKQFERNNVIEHIWNFGSRLKNSLSEIIKTHQKEEILELFGFDCRFMFKQNKTFDKYKFLMQEKLASKGILWNNMFVPSYSHTNDNLDKTINVFENIIKKI